MKGKNILRYSKVNLKRIKCAEIIIFVRFNDFVSKSKELKYMKKERYFIIKISDEDTAVIYQI